MQSFNSMLTRWVAAVLTSAALVAPALAADPNVVTTVSPVPATVTYSRLAATPPFVTYAAYEISITNNSTNTLNNVRLEGATSVDGSANTAPFVTSTGLACTTPASPTAIVCSIGQLRGGGGSASFVVIFQSPIDGSAIRFAWVNYYAEGSNDGGAHTDTNSGEAVTTLGTQTNTEVSSYVLPGGTLFTGLTGVATPADALTTKVTVPTYGKAEVSESTFADGCTNFVTCWQSQLSIPGTFDPYLTIVLSQDASNIKPGTKIASVVIQYEYFDASNVFHTHIVGDCASPTTPRSDGLPCIANSVAYKRNTPGWTPDLDGDFVWALISLKNGLLKIQ